MSIGPGNVHYTYAQLEGIWIQANGNPQYAAQAAAVATAESSGNSAAYNVNSNGSIDRGLWQVNSTHGAQSTFDVMANARAAVAISNNGTNWRPWCTAWSSCLCSGTYWTGSCAARNMQSGVVPNQAAPINGTNAAANQPGGAQLMSANTSDIYGAFGLSPIAEPIIKTIVGAVLNPIIQLTAGVTGIGAGVALMGFGVWLVVRQTGPYQQTAQAAGAVTRTGGRIASLFAGPEAGAVTTYMSVDPRTGEPRRTQVQRTTVRTRRGAQVYTTSTREQLRGQAYVYGPEGNVGFRPAGWQPAGSRSTRHRR